MLKDGLALGATPFECNAHDKVGPGNRLRLRE
jgi:hypothetical protein